MGCDVTGEGVRCQHRYLSPAPPKLEPAALFGNELPTTGGVKAEAGGLGSCKEDPCIAWWGGPDQTSFCKLSISGFVGLMASVAHTQLCHCVTKVATDYISMNERGCVPINFIYGH